MVAGADASEPAGAITETWSHPPVGVQEISLSDPSGASKYTFWLWLSGSKFVAGAEPSDPAGTIVDTGPHPLDGVQAISRKEPSGPAK